MAVPLPRAHPLSLQERRITTQPGASLARERDASAELHDLVHSTLPRVEGWGQAGVEVLPESKHNAHHSLFI